MKVSIEDYMLKSVTTTIIVVLAYLLAVKLANRYLEFWEQAGPENAHAFCRMLQN